jgi:L-amino acid N-acyltransferase
VQIRPAVPDDARALMEIYNPVVLTSTATFDLIPRTLEEQRAWISDRSGARVVLVAVDEDHDGTTDHVAGSAALSPYRDRAAYATTVENSVYVHEDHQGQGVGRILLEALVETARAHGFHAMIARIVSDHEASIGLHRACGFEVIGHEREVGRKFARWLDVTLMERLL